MKTNKVCILIILVSIMLTTACAGGVNTPLFGSAPTQVQEKYSQLPTPIPLATSESQNMSQVPTPISFSPDPMPTSQNSILTTYYYQNAGGKWATDVDLSWTNNSCVNQHRAWQALNGENTAWVHFWCNFKSTDDVQLALVVPTRYQLSGTELYFIIARDLKANDASKPSPYQVALKGDPNLLSKKAGYKNQLSWYIQGTGQAELADGSWVELSQSFWQIEFPEDSTNGIIFHLKNFSGEIWQGSTELTGMTCYCEIHSPINLPTIDLK